MSMVDIEFIAKNSDELKTLEKIMKAAPFVILPENLKVQVSKGFTEGFVDIEPKYPTTPISEIKSSEKAGLKDLNLSDPENRYVIIEGDTYRYHIHLKRREK